jgi:RNA polymerase sigma factor (sigma-70 family)
MVGVKSASARPKRRNWVLQRVIEHRYGSVADLCRASKEIEKSYAKISGLIFLRLSPFKKSHGYRNICLVLESLLGIPAERLFPEHLYTHLFDLKTNGVSKMINFTDLSAKEREKVYYRAFTTEKPPEEKGDLVLLKDRFEDVLRLLTYSEREIIKLRFGLGDGYVYTLEEVGNIFKLTPERIRQIQNETIKKLKEPIRSRHLSSFVE